MIQDIRTKSGECDKPNCGVCREIYGPHRADSADHEASELEQKDARIAELEARLAYLTVDCDEYVFKDGRCYRYEQDTICPREPRCHDKDRSR